VVVGAEGDLKVEGFAQFHCPFRGAGYEAIYLEL
jgi:hypothetical protein